MNKSLSLLASAALLLITMPLNAASTLTEVSFYGADNTGMFEGGTYWDSIGTNGAWNTYLFTGSTSSPIWQTSGDNENIAPNYEFTLGENILYVAADTTFSGYLGINLFFDDNLTYNRITAFVPTDNSTSFQVVAGSVTPTYGYGWGTPYTFPSSGSLSYTANGQIVTLTGFEVISGFDGVSAFNNVSNGDADTVAQLTFTVTAVPEPSTYVGLMGLATLGMVLFRKRFRK
jgi:hypothetical protein